LGFVVGNRILKLRAELAEQSVSIAFAYDPDENDASAVSSRAAYSEVLREEGIPFTWVPTGDLLLQSEDALRVRYPAIVFPDSLDARLTAELTDRMTDYVKSGGDVAVVYDAGSRDKTSHFLDESTLSPLVGINYGGYLLSRPRQVAPGSVTFRSSDEARAWSMPPGKLDGNKLVGYGYGQLVYPMNRGDYLDEAGTEIEASYGGGVVLSVRHVGTGNAIWMNLPLGYLKSHGDDLPLRSFVRTIARRFAHVPYLVSVPNGVGTVIIDWHIDSGIERLGIPNLARYGILRPGVTMEFDVTAGPDRDRPGDGLGIDACGKGRELVQLLARYGAIGSHGGWAHNWFARRLGAGEFTRAEIQDLVERNDKCLESIIGKPIVSYAAPVGLHPQPLMTQILAELGIDSYYYTGDTGAPPTRTFVDGEMVSESTWAFAIMPYHAFASIAEMRRGGVSPGTMYDWLTATAQYLRDEHTATLIYGHPYDLLYPKYALAYRRFVDEAESEIRAGHLQATTMPDFTTFTKRFMQTKLTVEPLKELKGKWHAVIENPEDLDQVTVALPNWLKVQAMGAGIVRRSESSSDYTFYVVTTHARRVEMPLVKMNGQGGIADGS
jgi:hypothetical protein